MEIKEKVAVVTGGGSGMGAATAAHLAREGAHVAILDFNVDAAKKVADEIKGIAIQCDVSKADSSEAAIQQVVEHYGAIHININCAGIATADRIVGREGPMSLVNFTRTIEVNLIGTFNIMRLCAAQMLTQKPVNDDGERGVIVNTASVAAYEGQLGQAAYSASKGGVAAMTLPAAREFAIFGVRVMTVAPGIIGTPMMQGMPQKVQDSLCADIPFPHRMGKPDEYASLVGQIVNNPYLNGSVIRFDAAIRMR